MSILSKLQLIAPKYGALVNAEDYIALADAQVSADMCNRDLVVAYLTAHIVAMANRGDSAGAVTSESEGALSRAYASLTDSLLGATSYGQEFLRLTRNCGKGSFVMRTFPA
jgi:hypothetical protein